MQFEPDSEKIKDGSWIVFYAKTNTDKKIFRLGTKRHRHIVVFRVVSSIFNKTTWKDTGLLLHIEGMQSKYPYVVGQLQYINLNIKIFSLTESEIMQHVIIEQI